MCLAFDCRLWFLLFLLVATFLIINFFCFLCTGIYEPRMFRQTFPLLVFESPVSSPHDILIVYSFQGIKGKIKGCGGDILPYKCKHLCMLKFREASASLTENSIYTVCSRLYYQSDNMVTVM